MATATVPTFPSLPLQAYHDAGMIQFLEKSPEVTRYAATRHDLPAIQTLLQHNPNAPLPSYKDLNQSIKKRQATLAQPTPWFALSSSSPLTKASDRNLLVKTALWPAVLGTTVGAAGYLLTGPAIPHAYAGMAIFGGIAGLYMGFLNLPIQVKQRQTPYTFSQALSDVFAATAIGAVGAGVTHWAATSDPAYSGLAVALGLGSAWLSGGALLAGAYSLIGFAQHRSQTAQEKKRERETLNDELHAHGMIAPYTYKQNVIVDLFSADNKLLERYLEEQVTKPVNTAQERVFREVKETEALLKTGLSPQRKAALNRFHERIKPIERAFVRYNHETNAATYPNNVAVLQYEINLKLQQLKALHVSLVTLKKLGTSAENLNVLQDEVRAVTLQIWEWMKSAINLTDAAGRQLDLEKRDYAKALDKLNQN